MTTFPRARSTSRRSSGAVRSRCLPGIAAALAALVLLVACGGGVGSGGTGTYASGTISGFGSIIVNEVRYDDSAATVIDDDDGARSNAELRLGMRVEIDAGAIASDADGRRAAATRIRFGSELVGPIEAIDTSTMRLTVLGQTVLISDETVFDDRIAGGLAGLAVGQGLEVHGLYDAAAGAYRASRVEPRAALAAWRIRGPVAALDAAGNPRSLRIGTAVFAWTAAVAAPADLAVGSTVRLTLAAARDGSGRYNVVIFTTARRPPPDRPEAEWKGIVTAFTSSARFSVDGVPVDAGNASFPDGSGALRLGARVEVKGRAEGGGLVASSVTIETESQVQARGFELKGPITAVDATARTLTVRGVSVGTARTDLRIDNGTRADLVVGRAVEVKALLATDRTRLEATRIVLK